MQDNSSIKSNQVFTGGKQWVDVDFLDPALLCDQLAKSDHQFFERSQVHRLASADALKRLVNLGSLDHTPRQSSIERRETESFVLEDLDQLTAHAEEQDRAELRIDAAAQDQLIAIAELDHFLNGDALEMLGAFFLGHRGSNVIKSLADIAFILEIQLHTADVGLMGDGFREKFQDNWET